jgi:hypothetical protein
VSLLAASSNRIVLPARLGRYEILRAVGRGGMAEVFLARSRGPGGVEKRVCIKRVLPALAGDPRAARRFSAEARTALSLQHANVVPVFDFGRDGQDLFLVMEWIDGCDLGRLLAKHRPFPPLRAVAVANEIAKALTYAQERTENGQPAGLVHRDVTPRNVLLSRRGEVRLTDFGVARVVGAAGGMAGTPRYMSPEQARGEPPQFGDDLYALGLVLAEMLLGHPVRTGPKGEGEVGVEAAQTPVEPPALPEAPEPLRRIVAGLLAIEPAVRPVRAAEVQASLARLLADAVVRGETDPTADLAAEVARVAPGVQADEEDAAPETAAAPTVGTIEAPDRGVEGGRRSRVALAVGVGVAGLLAVGVVGWRGTRVGRQPPAGGLAPTASVSPAPPPAPVVPPPHDVAPVAAPPANASPRPARTARLKVLAPGSWIAVFLDGRKLGDDAGLFTIPAGSHELRVENPPLGYRHVEAIVARPGQLIERTFHPSANP